MSDIALPSPGPEQQDAPLTEQERKLLTRLFSDPTYFPVEFRTWIKSYLETSDIRLPSSAIVGGNVPKVDLPAGIILPYGGGTIPGNCLICNGNSLLRADYELLFEAIGVVWGAVDATHFNLPDFRDRALYAVGAVVGLGQTDGRAVGSRGGPRHYHLQNGSTGTAGNHNHRVNGNTAGGGAHSHGTGAGDAFAKSVGTVIALGSGGTNRNIVSGATGSTDYMANHAHSVDINTDSKGDHAHTISGPTSGGYDQDRPSFAGVNLMITTGKRV